MAMTWKLVSRGHLLSSDFTFLPFSQPTGSPIIILVVIIIIIVFIIIIITIIVILIIIISGQPCLSSHGYSLPG